MGDIYIKLKEDHIIISHTGDNLYSDGKIASYNNINNITANFGIFTIMEKILFQNNLQNLAYMLRKTRLSYVIDMTDKILLVSELTFVINMVILVLIIKNYDSYDNYLFTTRDTCHLYNLFKIFTNNKNINKLYSSRKAYIKKSLPFNQYFRSLTTSNKNLLIDMNGTGKSVIQYLSENNINNVDILI